jgi:signal transduction histidine kinase/CheY-like chemotaxis protein
MEAFDLLAGLTARLASTARLDEIVEAVVPEIAELGFAAMWMAVLDDQTGNLSTLKEVIDGIATTSEASAIVASGMRQLLGHGFRERRVINVMAPDTLHLIERDEDAMRPEALALPRAVYERLRGHPFACCPLFGSRGQRVGAVSLSSYRGSQPIPDAVLSRGLLRAILDHLAIAMERALDLARIERLDASVGKLQVAIRADARIKAIGELAASAAHDLNNLSGIALLAVGVGLRSPAEAFDALPRIERANRAIGDLVARLQRIARPPSGDAANLQQVIEDVVIMTTPALREQSIEVDVELSPVPLVRCDGVLIHQIVLNLLINAIDALSGVPAEGRRITIRVRDDDGVVRLTVADTGPGIAPEVLARLFEAYITTKGSGHLGLGLAASHASLMQFGGHIEGRNAPPGGALFEVTLVAAPPGGTTESKAWIRPHARAPVTEGSGRARILAVDDDPDVMEIICHYLKPLGYEVFTATDPAQAIEAATSQVFDLVLCDLGLPKQSGLDVCVSLRQAGYRGKLVLMTGWDTQALSTDQRAAECDLLLKKPFRGTELIQVIDSLLEA